MASNYRIDNPFHLREDESTSPPTQTNFRFFDIEAQRGGAFMHAPLARSELARVWKKVAESLGYSFDPAKSPLRNDFVKDLVVTIGKYPCGQLPADILDILNLARNQAPSVVQLCKLQGFIKARDTLVVWEEIAKEADITVDFSKAYESAGVTIELAKGFAQWTAENSVKLQEIEALEIISNHLTSIPKELGALLGLHYLCLIDNQLREIPKELGALVKLKVLELLGNQLREIPKELGKLQNLGILFLSNNSLTSLPKELGALCNLTMLYLSGTRITSIPEGLRSLENLHVIGKLQSAHIDPRKDHGASSSKDPGSASRG